MSTLARQFVTLIGLFTVFYCKQPALSQSLRYETFGFNRFEANVLSPYQLVHVNKENAKYIRSLVKTALEAHGMSLHNNPDLLIDIWITITREFQSRGLEQNTNKWIPAYTKENKQIVFKEGVYAKVGNIKIEFKEADSGSILWQGDRSMTLWGKNEKTLRKNTRKAVNKILKKYDPTKKIRQ